MSDKLREFLQRKRSNKNDGLIIGALLYENIKLLDIVKRAANNSCCICCDNCLGCDAQALLRELGEVK